MNNFFDSKLAKKIIDDDGNVIKRGQILGRTKTAKNKRIFNMPMIVIEVLTEWNAYS